MFFRSDFFRLIRYYVARSFYKIICGDIDFWRFEIERIWELGNRDYEEYITTKLRKTALRDSAGNTIRSLYDLENAIPLSKKVLNSRLTKNASSWIMFSRCTSGTTGTRTKVYLNRDELSRFLAVRDYCFRKYGVKLGDREARLWGRSDRSIGNKIKNWSINRRTFNVAGDDLGALVDSFIKWRPDYIYGYSSCIISFSNYILNHKIDLSPVKLVVCTAEQILPEQKKRIGRAFGCNVVEEYGSTEFDIIAFEDPDAELRAVNPWLVLQSSNDELFVTDLLRESQQFVKYEIGDGGSLIRKPAMKFGGNLVVSKLHGRSVNRYAYDFNSQQFHSSEFSRVINKYLVKFSDDFDFSIIQMEVGIFEVYVSNSPENGIEHFCDYIKKALNKALNVSVNVRPGEVGSLEKFKGKRSYFVQNIDVEKIAM